MWIIAPLVVALVALLGWMGIVDPRVRARRRRLREDILRRASPGDLLVQAQRAVRGEAWQRLETGARLLSLSTCTDEELHACLKALFAEVSEEDHREGRSGRDSNFFEMYDCGLVAIIEALDGRLGRDARPPG